MNLLELKIWNQMQGRLMNFVLRYTKDKSLAEDIVHDVFLKVHDKLPQLREREKISGWIFQIARNTISDHFRNKSKQVNPIDLNWESEERSLNECVSFYLGEMIKTLPAKYREALELTEMKGVSQINLSEKLNISYSGAKSRIQRARQMLRRKMNDAYRIRFDSYGNAIFCERPLPCGCG